MKELERRRRSYRGTRLYRILVKSGEIHPFLAKVKQHFLHSTKRPLYLPPRKIAKTETVINVAFSQLTDHTLRSDSNPLTNKDFCEEVVKRENDVLVIVVLFETQMSEFEIRTTNKKSPPEKVDHHPSHSHQELKFAQIKLKIESVSFSN